MVSVDVYDKMKSYSGAMGSTATKVVEEALEDWLDTVGVARLESRAGIRLEEQTILLGANAAHA
jgi:hypothetical protein